MNDVSIQTDCEYFGCYTLEAYMERKQDIIDKIEKLFHSQDHDSLFKCIKDVINEDIDFIINRLIEDLDIMQLKLEKIQKERRRLIKRLKNKTKSSENESNETQAEIEKEELDSPWQGITNFQNEVEHIINKVTEDDAIKYEDNYNSIKDNCDLQKENCEEIQGTNETNMIFYEESGYYYDKTMGLFYDPKTGIYFYYNYDTQEYEFHSQIEINEDNDSIIHNKNETIEENLNIKSPLSIFKYAPCLRLIIKEGDLKGQLFIVTIDGAEIGYNDDNDISIMCPSISKKHAKIYYDSNNPDDHHYFIKDLNSMNGTFVNKKQIYVNENPVEIGHGWEIQFGNVILACHIHPGSNTCKECEPGYQTSIFEKNKKVEVFNKERERRRQLRRIKRKTLKKCSNKPQNLVKLNYTDRAAKRREAVGSDNPYEKTEIASIDCEIKSDNIGFKLMNKMGWKKGEGLGLQKSGIYEPVVPIVNNRRMGLVSANDFTNIKKNVITCNEYKPDIKIPISETNKVKLGNLKNDKQTPQRHLSKKCSKNYLSKKCSKNDSNKRCFKNFEKLTKFINRAKDVIDSENKTNNEGLQLNHNVSLKKTELLDGYKSNLCKSFVHRLTSSSTGLISDKFTDEVDGSYREDSSNLKEFSSNQENSSNPMKSSASQDSSYPLYFKWSEPKSNPEDSANPIEFRSYQETRDSNPIESSSKQEESNMIVIHSSSKQEESNAIHSTSKQEESNPIQSTSEQEESNPIQSTSEQEESNPTFFKWPVLTSNKMEFISSKEVDKEASSKLEDSSEPVYFRWH